MYRGFGENVISEIIVLSGLKNLNKGNFSQYYDTWNMEWKKEKENPNKSKEEIKAEIKEEIKKKINVLKKESIEKYYKLNNKKNKELEDKFKQIKLKVNFNSNPKILRDGKFYTLSQGCFTIYNDRHFNKLYEIKYEENYGITSAIELDNKDLVFFSVNYLYICRLKDGKYYLFQKIEENRAGFVQQDSYSGCEAYPKSYRAESIKEISGNRFICISNYGFKIYSLNEKNEYSIILLESYYEYIKTIHELDKNTFIFCSQIDCGASLGGPEHNVLIIDKIYLEGISRTEKENKLKELKERDYDGAQFGFFGYRNEGQTKKISYEEKKNVIESLKLSYIQKEFIKYSTYGGHHYFKGNAILKNKYFIIGIDNNILIYDISSGILLRRYEILIEGEDNLYRCGTNIRKWNNIDDNEFLLNINGNIVLFELTNKNELIIINQSYFEHINGLKILNEKNNNFYDDGQSENSYSGRYYFNSDNKKNNNCDISIYY